MFLINTIFIIHFYIDTREMLEVIGRTAIIYIVILIGIRVLGKKELSQLSLTDLVFVILISGSVETAMIGENSSLPGGLIAAATLLILNKVLKYLIYKSDRFAKILDGEAVVLIRHGKLNTNQLKKNRLSHRQLEEVCREQGYDDLSKIDLAILEVDGKVSIINDENIKQGGPFDVDADELQ